MALFVVLGGESADASQGSNGFHADELKPQNKRDSRCYS